MDRGRVSPASEATLPVSTEQPQPDNADANDEKYYILITALKASLNVAVNTL